MLLSNVAEATD